MRARNLNQTVRLTVVTVPTTHPAGTVGDHWYWELAAGGVAVIQQQTAEPVLEVSLAPGDYNVTCQLEAANNTVIGGQGIANFNVDAPDVVLQTASGTITVELV